jgi:putative ABC transport system ATP-binding protein
MQRVAVARALANRPLFLLADEPTGNLDSKTGRGVLNLLREAVAVQGVTLLLVTHDMQVASYADRIVHMLDGRVQRIELPPAVSQPVTAAGASVRADTQTDDSQR